MSNKGAIILAVVLVVFFVAFPGMIGISLGIIVLGTIGKAIEIGLRSLKNKEKLTGLASKLQDTDNISSGRKSQEDSTTTASNNTISSIEVASPNSQGQQMKNIEDWGNEQPTNDEDRVYRQIAEELETGNTDKGLWTRLFAECDGDEKKVKVLYIKQRAGRLISNERMCLEQAAREKVAEAERIEKLCPPPSDMQHMEDFGITFDGERYIYGEYKYDRLQDAINYAKLQKRQF